MAKASDNIFPKLIESMQTADPAAPSDSSWKLYAKAPGIYARSSNSVVGPFGAASLTSTQVFLGSDVTMTNANQFYDGPTYTPAAGTWLLIANASVVNNSGGGQRETFKLWDGTTAYASGQTSNAGTSVYTNMSLSAIVTGTGSAVFKMSIAGNGGTQVMMRHPDTNNSGLTGLGTSLIAIKIA